ncbi:putative PLAC8 motif-containing protein [Helianthus annuus]|uniref:Putative PLAC8 motif-containing protein n=1 Tax=Helianthus annuus TaxID=4232 RepID=A0A251RS07_HELAN|nr:putative PLAC8 motif-containing protein [Helianthus annuus]
MGRVEETLPDETTFQYSPSQGYPAQIPPYTNHHEIKQPLPPSQIQQPPAIYQPQHGIPQMYSYAPPPVTTPNWYPPPTVQEWTTGLLECFDDPEIDWFNYNVFFGVACGTSGLIYSLLVAFIGIPCIMSCTYRTKIRSRYNLLETPAPDWVIHLFCEYCALCQEYRELKNRGMDPALGNNNIYRQLRTLL